MSLIIARAQHQRKRPVYFRGKVGTPRMQSSEDVRKKVFVSYSHQDGDWLKRLQVHLKPLERRGLVELWDDTKIRPGDEWRKEISNALDSAKVAVLLISADFLASDFIAENELPPLLAAAEKDGLLILPLILRASLFDETESLSKFQSVNKPSEPLIKLSPGEQEECLVKLSKVILRAIEEFPPNPARVDGAKRHHIFNLPFPRNKFFTGRDDILNGLYTSFNAGETVQALNGLGGVGKTQTALEYAYRHQQHYQIVLWGKAHTRESLVTDFVAMAALLNLPEKNAQDQSEAAGAVKRWLENNNGWLLILDNADELAMAREFIPSSENGHVLLTTRAQTAGSIATHNKVEEMEPTEGALFLLRRLRVIKKDQRIESAPVEKGAQAEALSKLVAGLPLALDQAAAFIEEKPSTLEEYQTLYQSARNELLNRRGTLADDHPSVTVTFSLAFDKVEKANPAAADLLRVCAFLEADSIPEEIFSEGARELGEALSSIADSPFRLSDAIAEATRFSLLRRNAETRTVSLHRLMQAVLRDEMDGDSRRMWAERSLRAVNSVFPDVEYSTWPLCGRLTPHAQTLALLIDEYGFDFPEAARLMNQAGRYLNERAQYAEAESLLKCSLALREKTLDPEHLNVATGLNNLAALYMDQGKYVEAEHLLKRSLAIREKTLDPEHPSIAQGLSSLAALYMDQGKYVEAEPLFKRALAIREKTLGAEHPDVARLLNNLARLYDKQGKYGQAEALYVRALVLKEKALGEEHPDVARSLNNLARLYSNQGKYAEAEPLYVRALGVREKALGAEHPAVATSLEDYAELLRAINKNDEAEKLEARASAIRKRNSSS